MRQIRIPAAFVRGGTSNAVIFRRQDLPDPDSWPAIFCAALGSPDPSMRQLDGMGGGLSSLSKICVVGPSSRTDADVDYTFAQVEVGGTTVDMAGNCGNMSSAIGPFAVDEGLVPRPDDGPTVVRIHNTNSGKIIHARFNVFEGEATVDGDVVIPGVAGTGAPVELAFRDPVGTLGTGLLPAGSPRTELAMPDGTTILVTAVDAATPIVFVDARDVDASTTLSPTDLDGDPVMMARLEMIRRAASVIMGIAPDLVAAAKILSIPKIALVGRPAGFRALDGSVIRPEMHDIAVRMISAGQAHRAVPITGALALAAAATVAGGCVQECLGPDAHFHQLRVGTPSGVISVGTELSAGGAILSVNVIRTQRRLMEGAVCLRQSAVELNVADLLDKEKYTC